MYKIQPYLLKWDNYAMFSCEILLLINLLAIAFIGEVKFISLVGGEYIIFGSIYSSSLFFNAFLAISGSFSLIIIICILALLTYNLISLSKHCYACVKATGVLDKRRRRIKPESKRIVENRKLKA